MVQFSLWCLPLVFLAIIVATDLLGMIYDHTQPILSIAFVMIATGIFVLIVGVLYFAITQFILFGYVETKTFPLEKIETTTEQVAYVRSQPPTYFVRYRTKGEVFNDTLATEDLRVSEAVTRSPRLVCHRFATRFPRLFSGEFTKPSNASKCVAKIPTGTVLRKAG